MALFRIDRYGNNLSGHWWMNEKINIILLLKKRQGLSIKVR
jgi:hypothetical protein